VAVAKDHFVLDAARVEESQARRIAMHERARQVELLAEAWSQTGRADALRSDNRVPLENDRLEPRLGRFARRGGPRRSAADNDELGIINFLRP
jgi:hypothetical protein